MSLDRSAFMLDGKNGNIFFYQFPGLHVYNFTIRKSFSLELGRRLLMLRTDSNARFQWGFRLANGWLLENMVATIAVLVPNARPGGMFSRYQIERDDCSPNRTRIVDGNATISNANAREQAIFSFLYAFCELHREATNLVIVQRNVDAFIAVRLDDRQEFVYTIAAKKTGLDFRKTKYFYSNDSYSDGSKTVKEQETIKLILLTN